MSQSLDNAAGFLKEPYMDSPAEVRNSYVIAASLLSIAESLEQIAGAVVDDGVKIN